ECDHHKYPVQIHYYLILFRFTRLPPTSTLFPYTTLFRSDFASHARQRNDPLGETQRGADHAGILRFGLEAPVVERLLPRRVEDEDRKSTRLNSSHVAISYAVFCLKKKKN